MLYFVLWTLLMVAVIVAVPVAATMSPSNRSSRAARGDGSGDEPMDAIADDQAAMADDFSDVEPFGGDAFEEFK